MALTQMPNGAYVNLPDDITPEGLARVQAQYKSSPREAIRARVAARTEARKSQRQIEDEQQVAQIKARRNMGFKAPGQGSLDAATNNAVHMMTLGLDDVVGPAMLAGTEGVARAFNRGDIGQIGRTYLNAREAGKQERSEANNEHPIAAGVGSVAGLMTNPLGAETGIAKLASGAAGVAKRTIPASAAMIERAEKIAQALKASKVGQGIAVAGNSAIGTGARAGFNQGFVTGLTDTGNLEDATNEGIINGVAGGAFGGLLRGGQAAFNVVRNQSAGRAGRIAIERVAKMLDRSEDVMTGKKYTPQSVVNEIKATDAAGGDATVADLTREGQSWASYLAKQPGNRAAAHVINKAEERMDLAGQRFEDRVRRQLGLAKDASTAHATKQGFKAERKVLAGQDYTDAVMNRQMAWSDGLDDFFKSSVVAKDAMPGAEKLTRADRKLTQQNALHPQFGIDPAAPAFTKVPSMGVMDNVIKSIDDLVGTAMKAGNTNLARVYSNEGRALKTLVGEVNPEYAIARGHQRDLFERQESVELGERILKGLSTRRGAHELMDEITGGRVKPDDLKIGFADALMGLREKGDNPVALMRKYVRSDAQRAVLSHMFGGTKNLADFERFMRREVRALHTDAMVTSGRQMPSNVTREPPSDAEGAAIADIGKQTLQGAAFGHAPGAASRFISNTMKWSQMLSPAAKEELSRLLASKGDDLPKAIAAFKKQHAREIIQARRAYATAGKLPAAAVGGHSEQ